MKNKLATGALIIILICIAFLIYRYAVTSVKYISTTQNEENKVLFENELLGYKIEYKYPWRISTELSKRFVIANYALEFAAEEGCDRVISNLDADEEDLNADIQCIAESPEYEDFNQKLNELNNNWSSSKSETIVLTGLDKQEEQQIINKISSTEMSLSDITFNDDISEHFILISPAYSDMSFENEDSRRRKIQLSNNIIAYEFDATDLNGSITIYVVNSVNDGVIDVNGIIFKSDLNDNKETKNTLSEIIHSLEIF